ncbi:serine/threonine-protein kinase VRK1 [Monomorium pharaonis]|uniref:serine/threonine-protein kinase VRK1 n=1 Tax=Monomorium pharaonis TaxID=307658 RepID=UPI001746963D|nr:serine/threonine-protein kinase VRK1 [Monomorium pharaonis]
MATKAKKAPKKVGYQIPAGKIFKEHLTKNTWILGKSVSVGDFVEIYSATPCFGTIPMDYKDYPNVIKIEPHGHGQLFAEITFHMWNCKSCEIDNWQKKRKLTALGIPRYIGSGIIEHENTRYRFLIMDRYRENLWKIFVENYNRHFPEYIVYKLALQIIDILEYIHYKNYVHADIKGENLLLDWNSYDQVYLVNFGLASRSTSSTELKVDPKKAHNGTLQYMSRDAHMGVPTRRGDIESLCYNMIMWLCGFLPWEKLLEPAIVQKEKQKAFSNMNSFLDKCFHGSTPQALYKFMNILTSMKFNTRPSYEKLKETLIIGLKNLGHKPDGKLKLNIIDMSTQKIASVKNIRKRTRGIENKHCDTNDIEKALDDMDLNCEYDIQINKKMEKKFMKETNNGALINSIKCDSEDDSDIEPLSESSNKINQKKLVTNKIKLKIKSLNDGEVEIVSEGTKLRLVVNMNHHNK